MSPTDPAKKRPGIFKLFTRFGLPFLVAVAFFWWWLPSQPRMLIKEGDARLRVLGLSPDGTVLAVLKEDPPPQLRPDSRRADSAEAIAEGFRRASHFSGELQFWDVPSGKLRATVPEHVDDAPHVLFSPDGRLFATDKVMCARPCVHLWDTATGKEYGILDTFDQMENPLAVPWPRTFGFSPDSRTIAYIPTTPYTYYRPTEARLWDFHRCDRSCPTVSSHK